MTADVPDALADPVGVAVALVSATEPGLGRDVIEAAVTGVAAGRAKRRRLAQALAGRPGILTDGRSPAPRVAGDLLIALRNAGATVISPPSCAGCGRHLRTLQRRGQDWYCAVCGPRPGRCACCGQQRIIASTDRRGQPRCGRCPDRDDRDPLAVLTETIGQLDSSLPAETIAAAARRVFYRPAKLRQLAWVIEDEPGLLTGGGARAPIPGVLRLIDELCDAGAQAITRPACSRCQRVMLLYRRIDGLWCCRACVASTRAQPCARCGVVREAAIRDEHGRPLCPPGDLRQMRPAPPGQHPHPGRPGMPGLPPLEGADLQHLRQARPVPDFPGHRPAMVPGLQAALGQVRTLRAGPSRPRRKRRSAAVRHLHTSRARVLAQLPGLRAARPNPRRPVRPLHHHPAAA